MGFLGFSSKSSSPSVDQALSLTDRGLDELLKKHRGALYKADSSAKSEKAFKSAKEFRKTYGKKGVPEDGQRRQLGAFLKEIKNDGASNWGNQPVSSRVHPSRHRAALQAEVQQAIKSGDRAAQMRLRSEAQKHGYI